MFFFKYVFTSKGKLESKSSIHGLEGACFSMYFIEDSIITNVNNSDSTLTKIKIYLTQIKMCLYTDKLLIFLQVFEQIDSVL